MKVSEKQLMIMLRILEGSISFVDRSDMSFFGYDQKTRKDLFNEIINQQSDKLEEVGKQEEGENK